MVGGGLQDFSVSPSLFGTNFILKLLGFWFWLGLGDFGTKGLGTGLENDSQNKSMTSRAAPFAA